MKRCGAAASGMATVGEAFRVSDRGDDWVGVVCPVCQTRVYARATAEASQAECPDCFTIVRVPPLTDAAAEQRVRHTPDDPGTYAIAVDEDAPRRRPDEAAETEYAALTCPQCSTRLTPELRDRAWNTTCPDCLEVIAVPSRAVWRKEHAKGKTRRRVSGPVGYQVTDTLPPAAPSRGEPFVTGVFDAQAEIRTEPPPPIPRWTFISGVFGLPWRENVRTRWVYLSFGFWVTGFFAGLVLWLALGMGFYYGVPFFALPLIWVTLWTVSFAGTSFLTIVEDTANGNDRIEHWNEGSWKDWAADALAPLFLAALTAGVAACVGQAAVFAAGTVAYWPVFGVTCWLVFPFVLLSSMQQDSVWAPFSFALLKSMAVKAGIWLAYYAMAAAVAVAYLVLVAGALAAGGLLLALIVFAPLLAAAFFIEARLLGRLAWRVLIFDPETEGAKRRRRKSRRKRAGQSQRDDGRDLHHRIGSVC